MVVAVGADMDSQDLTYTLPCNTKLFCNLNLGEFWVLKETENDGFVSGYFHG